MMSYLFDFGDSNTGPIGACIRVQAKDRAEAVAKVKNLLGEYVDIARMLQPEDDCVEYANVYFNPDAVTENDISDEEEVEDE